MYFLHHHDPIEKIHALEQTRSLVNILFKGLLLFVGNRDPRIEVSFLTHSNRPTLASLFKVIFIILPLRWSGSYLLRTLLKAHNLQ